jgi:hypothetical protein
VLINLLNSSNGQVYVQDSQLKNYVTT